MHLPSGIYYCISRSFCARQVSKARQAILGMLLLAALLLSAFSPATARPLQVPQAGVTIDLAAEQMLGENFTFSVSFDNTSSIADDTGYGPYIDLYLPASGIDGLPDPGNDGITLNPGGATYLGAAVNTTTLDCPAGQTIEHPLTGDDLTCPAAPAAYSGLDPFTWELNVLRLPFGSFVANQPAITVDISANLSNLADLNTPLPVLAQGGFQYGADPLNNPLTDAPILGSVDTVETVPTLLSLEKRYIGPEDETATGPNYPRRYRLLVNIAAGQTITNLDVIDALPNNLQYRSVGPVSPASCAAFIEPDTAAPHNPPDNRLVVRCPSVTGTTAASEVSVELEFFVPRITADGDPVLSPLSGNDELSIDDARAEGDWTPVDTRDEIAHPVTDITTEDHRLTDKSIAIQKSVRNISAAPNSPGDVLEYSLAFQISDYFAFTGITIQDVMHDGQHFDASFTPTLSIQGNSFALPALAFDADNFTVTPNYTPVSPEPNDGSTALDFDISTELISRGRADGSLLGGCIPVGGTGGTPPDCTTNDGPTTGIVTFRTIIQDQFTDEYAPNTPSVDQGDTVSNDVTINGNLLDLDTLSANGNSEEDASRAVVSIPVGALNKTIYAINGSTSIGSPVRIAAGDEVTYRIEYDLPTSDVERFLFTDFLPLPIFDADEVLPPFNPTAPIPPPAGTAGFGPDDTFYDYSGRVPVLSINSNANSLLFDYGEFDDPANQATHVDLMFTVTVQSNPFADGLYLTNQARAREGSTENPDVNTDAIIQLQLTEPLLEIRKGIISADNPVRVFVPAAVLPAGVTASAPGSACPRLTGAVSSANLGTSIDSNATTLDGGDLVTFAVVVENVGSGLTGAFDVRLRDTIPNGFSIPTAGLNLCITDGNGTPLAYTERGAGLFGTTSDDGIELVDSGGYGSLLASDAPAGENIAVLTYDLQLEPTSTALTPAAVITNTATLFNYAGSEGGPDHTNTDLQDDAQVTLSSPRLAKALQQTEINNTTNTNTQAVIGETLDYRVTITLQEGYLPNLRLNDTLDSGLVFIDCLAITPSANITTSLPGGFTDACNDAVNPTVTNSGRNLAFSLGNVTNADVNNAQNDTITIDYRVVVTNITANQNDTRLNNAAALRWGTSGPVNASAANVTVIEPALALTKGVVVNGSGTAGDAGDAVQYTLVIRQAAGSRTDSFDVTLSDPLPRVAGGSLILNPVLASVVDSAGLVTNAAFEIAGNNTAGWTLQTLPGLSFDFPYSTTRTITLTVTGTLSNLVNSGQSIRNTGGIQWTSLDGSPGQRSTYNAASVERTGVDGAGGLNDYRATANADITVIAPTLAKQVISTSLVDTLDPEVVVGEHITYEVNYVISEGMSMTFVASDQLDPGMAFLSCDSVTASAALTAENGFSCDLAAFSPVAAGSISPDDQQGRQMDLNFGNVTNADSNNATTESITIRYTAVVINTAAAVRGAGLANHATGRWTSAGSSLTVTATTPPFYVAEPRLQIAKTASPASGDAGDIVTFEVTVTNAVGVRTSPAYDVLWSDRIPAGMTYVPGSLANPAGIPAAVLDQSGAPLLAASWDVLLPGQSATLTFQAVYDASVNPGQEITNTAYVTATSLPGEYSSPQSPYNDVSCERSGDPADCGGANNTYAANDPAAVTVGLPAFRKELRATSAAHTPGASVAVGETVTYALVVTLPEGTTPSLRIVDTLPAGLAYLDPSVNLDLGSFAGTIAAPTVTPLGGDVTIDFGEITVTADNAPGNNSFAVLLTAQVLNTTENQNGIEWDNSAAFTVDSLPAVTPDPVQVTVVEPELELLKTASDDTPALEQEITYTLQIRHLPTSTADAFDLQLVDTLPTGLTYIPDSISLPAGWTADDSAAPQLTFSGSLPLADSSVTITYRAHLAAYPDLHLGDGLTNPAVLDWTSLPGLDAGERTGEGDVNDYTTQTEETVIVSGPDLRINKTDGGVIGLPGGVTLYTLAYQNTGNAQAENVIIRETIPQYTSFNWTSSDPGWVCLPDETPGSVCTLALGTIAAGGSGSVPFGLLIDPTIPTEVTSIRNTAAISDDGTNGPEPTPENNTDDEVTPLTAAPDIAVQKTDGLTVVAPGTTLTYTITVINLGDQDATGVTLTDTLPAGVTFISASNSGVEDAGVITWPVFNLNAGQSVNRQVTVQVNNPYDAPTDRLLNTAVANDDGTNGEDPNPDDNTSTDEDVVAQQLTKEIAATNQSHTSGNNFAIGEIVTYQVTLVVPPGELADMTITDTLDLGLAYLDCDSITPSSADLQTTAGSFAGVCEGAVISALPDGSTNPANQGRAIRFDFDDLSNTSGSDQTITLRYRVVVLDNAANVRGLSLHNSVVWQWTGGTLAADAPTGIIVEPFLAMQKKVKPQIALPGSTVTYTLTLTHTPESNSDAFDVVLTDLVPKELKYQPGTLQWVSGQVPDVLDETGAPTLRVVWNRFADNDTNSVIEFKARLSNVNPGSVIKNTAAAEWSSLPGSVREPQSPENDLSTERFYDPGSNINIYGATAAARLTTPDALPTTGFAPGVITSLPPQPGQKLYAAAGEQWLEIPSQSLKVAIVGVPAVEGKWDLTWLGDQAGYLEGTAFPGLPGNTAITAHVYSANNKPGPFVNLKNLKWGDRLVLRSFGQVLTYEVRQVDTHLAPGDLSPLKHEEYAWLTLLTCEGFQPDQAAYRWRVAVRAVLVKTEAAP